MWGAVGRWFSTNASAVSITSFITSLGARSSIVTSTDHLNIGNTIVLGVFTDARVVTKAVLRTGLGPIASIGTHATGYMAGGAALFDVIAFAKPKPLSIAVADLLAGLPVLAGAT